MTEDRDDDAEQDKVGYRRPPKSGQFRKGQSGNPRGRPRKREVKPDWIEARYPTAEALRAEAARMLTINDASGSQQVTTREAVARALALAAMRGGVLAQRTFFERQKAEDERFHQRQKARFELWEEYQEMARNAIAAAIKQGLPEPEWVPHPEDIDLNYSRLEVTFLGAMDEEGLKAERQAQAFQRLGFEMTVYLGEDNCLPSATDPEGRIGIYMATHLLGRHRLPPRLRLTAEALEAEILPISGRGMLTWGDDLERRCAEGNVPFLRAHRSLRLPTRPMSRLGIRWVPDAATVLQAMRSRQRR